MGSRKLKWISIGIVVELVCICLVAGYLVREESIEASHYMVYQEDGKKFIKWVDFTVSYDALCKAYQMDVESYGQTPHADWIELLAYTAAKTGGTFNKNALKYMDECMEALQKEKTMEELTKDLKYYEYYIEAYRAVLGGLVGKYQVENENGETEEKYGLIGYSPIAKGFDYSDYDDFGTSRSYGYSRPHLGHDMMGLVGTPIIAVESGYVEALGWNQYGGWRIGIRSNDSKRYYYYAHLRQNRPYAQGLKEGDQVTAGDVIGYMGHTGYSSKENTNNINTVHLHFGLELVFDESQKESDNEIWVDCYALTRFLEKNRSAVQRDDETKEWSRISTIEIKE